MQPWFGYHIPSFTFPDTPPEGHLRARRGPGPGRRGGRVQPHHGDGPLLPDQGRRRRDRADAGGVLDPRRALAARTSTARLGTLVTGVTYRNPAILAKTVTTLDVISGGRAILGIGAAWNEDEHAGYGVPFPPIGERMDRLDEALTICHAMFTEERPTFTGRHYRIESALNIPRPIQPKGPPVLVGGGGEQRTLRIAAAHADMTHWFPLGLDALAHKTEVLARHCDAIGRDPATIERTMATPVLPAANERDIAAVVERMPPERRAAITVGTIEQCAEALAPYIAGGFTGFTFNNPFLPTPDSLALAGELLRLVS